MAIAIRARAPRAASIFALPTRPATEPSVVVQDRLEALMLRAGFIATGALLLHLAMQTWQIGNIGSHREVLWIVLAQYSAAFALMAGALLRVSFVRRFAWVLLVAVVLATLSWFYVKVEINLRAYGTDNAAFAHVAAENLIAGQNPYAIKDRAVIEAAAQRFGVPATFITSTTGGQSLDNLMSWPAGSVLTLVPAFLIGVHDVRWVVIACEIAVLVLLWWRSPRQLRPLVLLPIAIDPDLLLEFSAGGVMDYVWVLPVLASAIALYARREGWAALLFGLSAGIKQQPWLLAPFLAIWIWQTCPADRPLDRVKAVAQFATVSAAGFLALNLPFMAWDLRAWLYGVMLPFRADLVPFGSGISLLTQTGMVQLPKTFYSAATFGVWGVLLLAYALHFKSLKHALWLAPAVIMWFGYRSLQNYFIYWTPLVVVAMIAWWEEEGRAPSSPG